MKRLAAHRGAARLLLIRRSPVVRSQHTTPASPQAANGADGLRCLGW
jgi:hypothetical protein